MPNDEKPTIPKVILDLVERFERNREAYKSGHYNETQVRREFLDPFFEALGWSIDNKQGYAEDYKDVIHEDAIKTTDGTKAPDYCFRIGGTRKFFRGHQERCQPRLPTSPLRFYDQAALERPE